MLSVFTELKSLLFLLLQGFGMLLMEEAERIAKEEHGSWKIAVISGIFALSPPFFFLLIWKQTHYSQCQLLWPLKWASACNWVKFQPGSIQCNAAIVSSVPKDAAGSHPALGAKEPWPWVPSCSQGCYFWAHCFGLVTGCYCWGLTFQSLWG